MRWLDSNTDSRDMNLSKLRETGEPGMLQSMQMQRVRDGLATEQQQSNTEQWEACLRFKYLFWASVATTMNKYLFGTLLMDCNHVFMTKRNNVCDKNLHKLEKLNNILNTILIGQVVLLGLYSLVLQRYWNTPNKTNEKCIFYIIHCQLLILAQLLSYVWLFATPWTAAHQTPLSMEFSSQELEWLAISYFREFSQPRDWICISCVSCIGRWVLYHCATWESPLALEFSWIYSWYILSDTQLE